MAYTQVKKPNLDPIIYQGGGAIGDWLGMCLAYVQFAFGTGWAGATAADAMKNVKVNKGTPPGGVYVPIWFSHRGTYAGQTKEWGHVAIYKDGKVWSSPISHKPFADKWNSIKEVEQKYNAKYLGWSDSLAGSTIIKENKVAKLSTAQITKAYQDLLGRKPDAGGLKHYLASGFTDSQLRADIKKSAEYKKRQDRLKKESEAKKKADAAKKAAEEAQKAKEAEEAAKNAHVDKWGEENNNLLKQILALLKSVFNR